MRSARSRLLATLLVATLPVATPLLLLSAAGCARGPARSGGQDPVPVTVGVVARKDVPVRIDAIGTVEAYSTVSIKAQIGGVLEEVHFREGQDVRKGDLLFKIDSRPYDAALEAAKAQLAKDTVQLRTARQDFERYADLVKKEYVTQEEYERIRTNAESLEAAVRADEAAVENAAVQLDYCTIRSPIDGRTGQLKVHAGNLIKANGDDPLVVINQVDPIYVAFSVPEQRLGEIKARQAAGALPVEAGSPESGPGRLAGRLTLIDNAVDRTTGTFLLKATFQNHQRLLWPGQFVSVSLQVATRPGALVVPAQAIQTGQSGPFLFVVKPDLSVESRSVTTGATIDQETVIEKGVAEGERVVTDGQLRLVPGARVEVKPGAAAGAAS